MDGSADVLIPGTVTIWMLPPAGQTPEMMSNRDHAALIAKQLRETDAAIVRKDVPLMLA